MISALNLHHTEKLLLYVIQERIQDNAEGLSVTTDKLGEFSGLSRASISAKLKKLHEEGYIVYQRGVGRGVGNIKLNL